MATVVSAPYNLSEDSLIKARVSALNIKGWGLHSELNSDGSLVLTNNYAVEIPVLDYQTRSEVSLTWPEIPEVAAYEVQWFKQGEFVDNKTTI
jgi:hypothetical protein